MSAESNNDPGLRRFRLLSIPAAHPYVKRIWDRSIDVTPDPTDPWWPHRAFDLGHLDRVAADHDAVHVNFGFEHLTPGELALWVERVAHHGLPLLVTVHDLENPHLLNTHTHLRSVSELIAGATLVITLTPGAASEIRRRWGIVPTVIPHPPLAWAEGSAVKRVVGVDYFHERPNLLPPEDVVVALGTACERTNAPLRVRTSKTNHSRLQTAIRRAGLQRSVELTCVDLRPSEHEFNSYLASHAVVVLPYRHGTHSGRLELCSNLGVRVVSTPVGFFDEQNAPLTTLPIENLTAPNPGLDNAIRELLDAAPHPPLGQATYDHQILSVQQDHRSILDSLQRHSEERRGP